LEEKTLRGFRKGLEI